MSVPAGRLPKLLLLTGMQKSGTTLLQRACTQPGMIDDPWTGREGNDFWGNLPPDFDGPAGRLYLRLGEERGHELLAEDVASSDRDELVTRLAALQLEAPALLNKNPYNVVRLPWLRRLFPDAFVVLLFRRAKPNVHSILKKIAHNATLEIENEWYGVKPAGWRELLDGRLHVQIARQWQAVNRRAWEFHSHADLCVAYSDFVAAPNEWVERIGRSTVGRGFRMVREVPPLRSFDDEYGTGATHFESVNRIMRRENALAVGAGRDILFPPLDPSHCEEIDRICGSLEAEIFSGVDTVS